MKIQLIRNATLVVQYAGKKFLIDPFWEKKIRIRLSLIRYAKIKTILWLACQPRLTILSAT